MAVLNFDPSFHSYQIVVFRVQLNRDVLVLIKQSCVMHLPGNRPHFARCGVLEIKYLNGRNSHASRSLGGVRQYLHPVPCVDVEVSLHHRRKLLPAIVVHSWPVIPVSAVGNLKLNPTERIERCYSGLRATAKDENAGLMIRIA